GTLSMFNNNLEFVSSPANPFQTFTIIGHTSLLPTPVVFAPDFTNNAPFCEALEGSVIMVTNVFIPANTNLTANRTITGTIGGLPFLLFFPATGDKDVQFRTNAPLFAWSIYGIFNQFKSGTYSPAGYEINIVRWGDILTNPPPAVTASAAVSGKNVVLSWLAAPLYSTTTLGAYS